MKQENKTAADAESNERLCFMVAVIFIVELLCVSVVQVLVFHILVPALVA